MPRRPGGHVCGHVRATPTILYLPQGVNHPIHTKGMNHAVYTKGEGKIYAI